MINRIISSVSLSVIGWGIVSIYGLYKEHIKILKSEKDNKNTINNILEETDIQERINKIKEKEEELIIREKLLEENTNNLRIREEVIVNMERAYSSKNDQLTELINSMNNFCQASDKIVKSHDNNFCMIST